VGHQTSIGARSKSWDFSSGDRGLRTSCNHESRFANGPQLAKTAVRSVAIITAPLLFSKSSVWCARNSLYELAAAIDLASAIGALPR
jgi:hypothetical protein